MENKMEKKVNIMCMLYPNRDPKRAHVMQEFIDGLDNLVIETENCRFEKLYAKCDDYFKSIIDRLRASGDSYSEVLLKINKVRDDIIEEVANKFLNVAKMDCGKDIINYQSELIGDIKKALLSRTYTIKNIRFKSITKKIKKYNG